MSSTLDPNVPLPPVDEDSDLVGENNERSISDDEDPNSAEAPGVTDDAGVARLYGRIGMRRGRHQYETRAALLAGRQIRRELFA